MKYDKKAKGNDDKKTNDDKLAHCKISPLLKRNERWDKEWESVKNDIHGARPKRKAVAKASLVSRAVCDQVAQQVNGASASKNYAVDAMTYALHGPKMTIEREFSSEKSTAHRQRVLLGVSEDFKKLTDSVPDSDVVEVNHF